MKGIEVARFIADDDTCAVLKLDTVFAIIDFLEFFHVIDGQIIPIGAITISARSCKQ